MKKELKISGKFKRDIKKYEKDEKIINNLKLAIDNLALGKKLDIKFQDHKLTGNLKNFRECHVFPDILLVYEISDKFLYLYRFGTHSKLF